MRYVISYDLNDGGPENYQRLWDALQSLAARGRSVFR